jgi:hypothetical protein
MRPFGVALGSGGEIVVSDHRRAEVYVFRAHGTSLVQKISLNGDSRIDLQKPWGLAIDSGGNIFVGHQCLHHGHLSKLSF